MDDKMDYSYMRSGNIQWDTRTALLRIKQLNESADIINQTTNVSTFFSRFEFALQICDELVHLEYTGCMHNISPAQQKKDLISQLPGAINSLILRCYNKEYSKSKELKTERGRNNRMIRFFNNMVLDLNRYGSQYITETNIKQLCDLAMLWDLDDEIEYSLIPVTLPTFDIPQTSYTEKTVYVSESTADSIKLICPKCQNIFIEKQRCPECDYPLEIYNEFLQQEKDLAGKKQKKDGKDYGAVSLASIFFLPIFLIGFFLLILDYITAAVIAFLIYILILYIIHKKIN